MAATPATVRVWEAHFTQYRAIMWSNILGSFVQPFMYLLGMGLGVGALVDRRSESAALLDGLSYYEFLAPALIATTAMMIGAQSALWPVMGGFKWHYTFHAQASTPLSPRDILVGKLLFDGTRCAIAATGVAAALAWFDGTRSFGLLLTVPFGALCGLAFTAPIMVWSASRDSPESFPAVIRFGIIPLFLFGGAFYPVGQLPDVLEPFATATPLWHGVELCRGAVHGTLGVRAAIVHVAVLTAFLAVGAKLAIRSFERRLGT